VISHEPTPEGIAVRARDLRASYRTGFFRRRVHALHGLTFDVRPAITRVSYLRAFPRADVLHGMARLGQLLRSTDALGVFEIGPNPFRDGRYANRVRHVAVTVRGNSLIVFFTAIGDDPERVLASAIEMNGDWTHYGPKGGLDNSADIKKAFKRFQDAFAAAGVPPNAVRWVFAPNNVSHPPGTAAQLPAGLHLVGGLVVVVGGVLLALAAAPAGRLAKDAHPRLDVERGHPGLREGEVVGAEEQALLGRGIAGELAALGLRDRLGVAV
jgi:hypothetical protein